jgi:hypothetical protein
MFWARLIWLRRLLWCLMLWILLFLPALGQLGQGWEMFAPREQTYVSSREPGHSGRYSASLRSLPGATDESYALVVQRVDALNYRGSRVRLSGYLRCQLQSGWSGLWLRVDPIKGPPLAFENMQKRPVTGHTEWNRYQIELDVPAQADSLNYGGLLSGRGQVWLDDFQIEVVGLATPGLTEMRKLRKLPVEPCNLGFEK